MIVRYAWIHLLKYVFIENETNKMPVRTIKFNVGCLNDVQFMPTMTDNNSNNKTNKKKYFQYSN